MPQILKTAPRHLLLVVVSHIRLQLVGEVKTHHIGRHLGLLLIQMQAIYPARQAPLLLLSGGVSPRESMPPMVQNIMLGAPTTYFVRLAQGILFRGAGIDVVWGDLMLMGGVGAVFFSVALYRFRKAVTQSQA